MNNHRAAGLKKKKNLSDDHAHICLVMRPENYFIVSINYSDYETIPNRRKEAFRAILEANNFEPAALRHYLCPTIDCVVGRALDRRPLSPLRELRRLLH